MNQSTVSSSPDLKASQSLNLKAFGKRLQELRKQKNLTLSALAVSAGISIGYLSNLERAYTKDDRRRVTPSLAKLEALRKALGAQPSDLYHDLGILPMEETGFSVDAPTDPPEILSDGAYLAMLQEANQEVNQLKEKVNVLERKYMQLLAKERQKQDQDLDEHEQHEPDQHRVDAMVYSI